MRRVATDHARRIFTLDLRSLALMRIAVAATVLVDLVTRLVHCAEHYSDEGVLPRATARSVSWLVDTSLLSASGSPSWTAAVFVAAIALAIAVLVGWRTRLSTLLLWLAVLAIQHRNPLLWDHRDALFACALCLGLLLPWGEAFSLDARRRGAALVEPRYVGVPAAAYVIQVACIYLFAALLKDGPEWRSDFTAVEHAIRPEYWANPAASLLLDHPTLASILTAAVLGFEAAVAPLLLVPWRGHHARWAAIAGICMLQLGFAVFLWLDVFPMIAAAMVLGLIPTSLWSRWCDAPDPVAPARARPDEPRWITLPALALAIYTVALNVMSLDEDPRAFALARRPAELLGIEQNWNMFAPSPTRLDGWFVVLSRNADGSQIDLLTGRTVDWSRPDSFREGIRTTRELVYMRRLLGAGDAPRESFAAAHCGAGTVSIAVYFVAVYDGQLRAPERLVERACR